MVLTLTVGHAEYSRGEEQQLYVDASVSSSGNGTLSAPYRAFSNINWTAIGQMIATGDVVFVNLRRGCEWREELQIGAGGTSNRPLTIQSYGEGAPPVINGAADYSAEPFRWNASSAGNQWYLTTSAGLNPQIPEPGGVWLNERYQFIGEYAGQWTPYIAGNLAADRWAWGDADGLGFSTVYIYSPKSPALAGLRVEGSARSKCVYIYRKDYVTIRDVEMKQSGLRNAVHPICYVYESDFVVLDRVFIHDASGAAGAIYVMRSSNFVLRASTVRDCYDPDGNGYGSLIYFESGSAGTCQSLQVVSNRIYGCYARGGDLVGVVGAWASGVAYGAVHGCVEYNELSGPAQNAVYFRSGTKGNVIRHNFIHDIKGYNVGGGIAVQLRDGANDNVVYNNVVLNVYGPALQSDGKNGGPGSVNPACHGNRFIHNTIANGSYPGANGFHFFGSNTQLEVRNNLLISNSGDMLLVGADSNETTYAGVRLSNNRYFKTTDSGQSFVYRGSNYKTLAAMQAAMLRDGFPNEENSSFGLPLLVYSNPTTLAEAHLAAGSPCINAGVFVSPVIVDYDLTSRLNDAAPDIGALEFIAAKSPMPISNLRRLE
jgi:hypothetical protein